MRAVVVAQTGGPEVLELKELPTPEPRPGEVRVDVDACGVNFLDVYERSGKYPMQTPFIAGSEGCGVVSAVGDGVDTVTLGDRVAWAMVHGGGYAGQVVIPAERTAPVPDDVKSEQAAAVMLQGMTAHYLTESTFPVRAGQTALVHAAAGGLGLLLTQMLVGKGVRVIGTASTAAKASLATEAGTSEVIDYTDHDVAVEVRRLTDGRGVDVVYDGVGKATFDGSIDSLARRGTMVLVGAASGPVPPVDPQTLNKKGSLFLTRPTLAHHIADRDELLERAAAVLGQVAEDRLAVRIGGKYPLAEAAQAHEDLVGRRSTGKLLILPDL
ncbi:MAG: quinone oxidoreductase [Actinomycetales bacterium]|nr:quinone oxidoreductase [Actinomycetales bacterium]